MSPAKRATTGWRQMICRLVACVVLMSALPAPCAGAPDTSPVQSSARELVGDLEQTLEASLTAEKKTLKGYEERLARADRERIYLAAAANAYQLQLSTFSNLLLSAGVDISVLQKTRADLKSSLMEIQKMTESLAPGAEAMVIEKKNLDQQKELVMRQAKELSKLKNKNKTAGNMEKTARQLEAVLREKEVLVSKLDKIYQHRLNDLTKLAQSLSDLAGRFDAAIQQRKAKNLFERQDQVFRFDALTSLKDDTTLLARQFRRLVLPDFWLNGFKDIWQSGGLGALSIVVVLYSVIALLIRIRRTMLQGLPMALAEKMGPWNCLAAQLAGLSVIPGGIALTLFLYSRLDTMYLIAPFLRSVAMFFLIFLAVRWVDTALSGPAEEMAQGEASAGKLIGLVRSIALFSLIYLPVYAVLGQESALLVAFRLAFALGLLIWTLITWRNIRLSHRQDMPEDRRTQMVNLGCKYLLSLICCVALVLDMTGYASLSFHWLLAWTKTAAIAFWWWIFLAMLREWDAYYREKSSSFRNELLYDNYPVQWVLIRAGQLFWLVTLGALLLLAWGNRQTVLEQVYRFLAHPLDVGNMKFSFLGLIYAVLVIAITYALTRIWKWLFQSKFLGKSGMDIGLQASITTITIYVIWAFGILVSLHVFGLNTASLAVAFGALGIGLGFGLQNIFNNFISGIILLFERPIQVGDDVEINGIWAQVKKINVRSTVVQTYDNASLIIPNADFISTQVTNWSFKDKRIRRSVTVGVAYGSDITLVRDTLLEIAAKTAKVLKSPKPDVLFKDFADSALLFKLRVWTDIDHMLKVETNIRFDIDRIFKERAIEISFPQRDIHIRSAKGLARTPAPEVPPEEPPEDMPKTDA